jgi:hypothetical protein
MSIFKNSTKMSSTEGNSRMFPQEPAYQPTFWGSGWGQAEEEMTPGKMESGDTGMGRKGGKTMGAGKMMRKCAHCG